MKFILGLLIGFVMGASTANAQDIQLDPNNTIVFRGEVSADSVNAAILKLIELIELNVKRGKANYPLYLVLDSPGGSISDGLDFIDYAKSVPNLKTVTLFAASMASAIVEALPGERLVTDTGILMFHRAAGTFSGQFETGELESRLEIAKTVVRHMESTNADRIGISLKKYKSKVVSEWWIFGKFNIYQKTADRVVNVVCSQELIDSRIATVEQGFFSSSRVTYSGCPLIKAAQSSTDIADAKRLKFK